MYFFINGIVFFTSSFFKHGLASGSAFMNSVLKRKNNSYSLCTSQTHPKSCLEQNAVIFLPPATKYLLTAILVTTLLSWSPCYSSTSIGICLDLSPPRGTGNLISSDQLRMSSVARCQFLDGHVYFNIVRNYNYLLPVLTHVTLWQPSWNIQCVVNISYLYVQGNTRA